ncbi:MAG: hypothetical protein FJZ01_27235 [Candidatus Sericytochromatia bacterium]|nr:hypothetical protein [Candidatus Tanganyikabacteria bacterium]
MAGAGGVIRAPGDTLIGLEPAAANGVSTSVTTSGTGAGLPSAVGVGRPARDQHDGQRGRLGLLEQAAAQREAFEARQLDVGDLDFLDRIDPESRALACRPAA